MFVTWIRSFHHWIRYSYLAIWLSRTSCTDQVKHIFKTAQISVIFLQCWQQFFLPIFVLETSTGVGHSSVDRLWDDDRLSGQTTRSEHLQLAVLFVVFRWRCNEIINIWIQQILISRPTIVCVFDTKLWTSPTGSTLLRLLELFVTTHQH